MFCQNKVPAYDSAVKSNRPSRSGSTLVITLMVVSLMLIMVLAFTAHVRFELRNVQNEQNLKLARANARLSLNLGLGKLQEAAGMDRRATARAEIMAGSVPGASLWTGVWTNDLSGDVQPQPVWLVSGTNPNPSVGAGSSGLVLFPAVDNAEAVRAPTDTIRNASGNTLGRYAFWISDEASKASLQSRRQAVGTYAHPSLAASRRNTEYQVNFGIDLPSIFPTVQVDLKDAAFPDRLFKVVGINDLPLVADSSGNALLTTSNNLPQHRVTPRSLGVLESPRTGGLKRNLADPAFRDDFLATAQTAAFLGPKSGSLAVESGTPASLGVSDGQPLFSPRPLLTEAVLYMGMFFSTTAEDYVRVRFHVRVEILNPYSMPLVFSPKEPQDAFGDRGFVLLFQNLPTVTVRDLSGVAPTLNGNLNSLKNQPYDSFTRPINSWIDIQKFSSSYPILQPGEIYGVLEPNPILQTEGLARTIDTTKTWKENQNTLPDPEAQIQITAVHPPGGLTISAKPYQHSASIQNLASRPDIFSYSGLKFDDFTITKPFNSAPSPFSIERSGDYKIGEYLFAYHFRLFSEESDPTSLRDLLSGADLLDPDFEASRNFTDLDGNIRTHAEILDPISTDPTMIVSDLIGPFSELDHFDDITERSHIGDFRQTLLVDVPNNDALSIGQLSSLPIYRRAFRIIGSPRGDSYNAAFDRYFLSPKITNPSSSQPMLRNPALHALRAPIATAASSDAQHELVDGSFNLNSTSVDAWEALLSAPILTPAGYDETAPPNADGLLSRPATFFRLPLWQSRGNSFAVSTNELVHASQAFAQGIRSLDGPVGRTQLRQVATNIVQSIQSRGKPFPDMQSFVSSGILQKAIDDVPEINENLFEQSNVALLQQDLLHRLAPSLAPRSDTFVIRAYGDVNPSGSANPISRAYCEAVVQRLPSKIDGSDPMTLSDRVTNLRDFQIVSFRWLTDEDL
jgi:hypothetical protein